MSTILVVADNEMTRNSVAATLTREGCAVTTVASAHEALERLGGRPFDAVLSDLQTGDSALVEAVRRKDDAMPVIVMTTDATAASAADTLDRGAYDYVTKPFSTTGLVHTVRRAVEHRALTREHAVLRTTLEKIRERMSTSTPVNGTSTSNPNPNPNPNPIPTLTPVAAAMPPRATGPASAGVESKPDPDQLICGAHYRLADLERDAIVATLQHYDGHRQRSAKALGIGVRTLGLKLKKWKEMQLVSPNL